LFALGKEGDVFMGFTTSGNSKNILKAMKVAAVKGIKTVIMTGASGGKGAEIADYSVKVPENETYKIQELHLPVYHTICLVLEENFYGKK
jgi:D-sedoheptulose 7-phosphate isomerase